MNKITTISASTLKKGSPISAPKDLFGLKNNPKLLAQALHVYEDRSHTGIVIKKTRGEVSRTKAKWYKQKGTGGARHGSKSPNIFVGGGLAHGPSGKKRVLTLPKNIRLQALKIALSQKLDNEKVFAISNIESIKKTKKASELLQTISKKGKFVLALSAKNKTARQFFKNIPNIEIVLFKNLNAQVVNLGGTLLIDSEVFKLKTNQAKK